MAVTETFVPGFRLQDGSALNRLVDQANGLTDGTSPVSSTFSRQSAATGLTATGTTRANALALTSAVNVLGTVASGTGAVLPPASTVGVGGSVVIFNDGASAAKIYADGSDTIDGTAGATGVTLTNALRCEFYVTAPGVFKSAKLGATST